MSTAPTLSPGPLSVWDRHTVARAVESLVACAMACNTCADACLEEESVGTLGTCVRANRDCADSCSVTARMLSRHTGAAPAEHVVAQVRSCLLACRASTAECAPLAIRHEHCATSAEAGRASAEVCAELLARLA